MAWIQFRVATDQTQQSTLENALLAVGAVSITAQNQNSDAVFGSGNPKETPPIWETMTLTALFDANINTQYVLEQLYEQLNWKPDVSINPLEDKDWSREWMQYYQPIPFNGFWICPSWITPPEPDAINLILDPGLAFGTGTHPTTALCMQWLAEQDVKGKTVIDYGCGSGIIAIAAALLGAKQVYAIDLDPQAVTTTKENAKLNQCTDRVHAYENADFDTEHYEVLQADIVIANILAGPLAELKPTLLHYLKPTGDLVLSGLLANQSSKIINHYTNSENEQSQTQWQATHHVDDLSDAIKATMTTSPEDQWISMHFTKN